MKTDLICCMDRCLQLVNIRTNNNMLISLFTNLLSVCLVVILYRKYRKEQNNSAQLRQTKVQLEQSNKRLSRFVHSISHDIIGKLDSMLTSSNSIQKKDLTTKESKRYYHESKDTAAWLKVYCSELLMWSDKDLELPPSLLLTPMSPTVEDLLQTYRAELEHYSFEVLIGQLPEVQLEQAPLRQVLNNLIGNAIKYTKQQPFPKLEISAVCELEEWTIKIKDNGIGIPKEQRTKIFRLPDERTRIQSRGLSYVKSLLLEQEETIWAEDNEWGGTTFYFTARGQKTAIHDNT